MYNFDISDTGRCPYCGDSTQSGMVCDDCEEANEMGNVVDNGDGTVTVTEYNPHIGETHTYNMPNWYIGPEEEEMDPFDEFRGDVAMELRERGYVELADYYGSVPDEVAEEDYHDVEGRVAQFADEFIEFMEESC